MSQKTVCRVCAADNVIMYSIADTELQGIYEKLTNISLHADSRPLTVCYVCHSQLQTTRKLLLKALKVEEILVPILSGEVQLSTLDRQANKLTSSLSLSRTEYVSTLMQLCTKEEPPEESVGGCNQQELTWRETLIKLEPVSDNPSNEPNSTGDAALRNPTGALERRLTRHQDTFAEKDAGISIIKEEPVCDHHDSIWEADLAGDARQSYDIEFVVPRETTNDAKNFRKRKDMLQQTENAGTSAHDEATYFDVSKTKIVTKTSSELDLERDTYCICNDCNKAFNSKTILIKHIRRHKLLKVTNEMKNRLADNLENSKWHACHMCDIKFKHAGRLKVHIRTHTGEKPLACHMCTFKCNNKSILKIHLRKHTGEKPYACHMCDYRGTQASHIKAHLRTHTSEKPYSCHLCDYKFKYKSSLRSHLRKHTDDNLHTCHLCAHKFIGEALLKRHLSTHTGEKPYACHLCENKYKTNRSLRLHLRKHTGETPYTCHLCDHKFPRIDYLKRHLRKQHTGEKP